MFDWDELKREQVIRDHGVDFAQIEDVFDDPFAVHFEDVRHSTGHETRFSIIAQSARYGLVFAAYTYRGDSRIRFITARRAANWMVREYEENRKRF